MARANGGTIEVKFRGKRTRRFLAVAVVMVAVLTAFITKSRWQTPPQYITHSDGLQYRFVGVTWGTNHSQPGLLARIVDHLPNRWANYFRTKTSARWNLQLPYQTAEPSLGIWLLPVKTNWSAGSTTHQASAMLADGCGVEAGRLSNQPLYPGASAGLFLSPGSPTGLIVTFTEVPRRSRILECHFYSDSTASVGTSPGTRSLSKEIGTVRFANPLYRRFPTWQPEILPATKMAGDLQVRLTNCFSGFSSISPDPSTRSYTNGYRSPDPGETAMTAFDLQFHSPRGTNESWNVEEAELSDATGNRLTWRRSSIIYSPVESSLAIPGILWPSEPALRLKLGLKRTSGYPTADLITFSNLPLTSGSGYFPTTGISLTNFVAGNPIVVRNFLTQGFAWSGPRPSPYWVEVGPPDHGSGVAVDIVKVVTDTGQKPVRGGFNGQSKFWWNLESMPEGTRFLNVTVAVQKERQVEFFVKPAPK